MHLPLSFKTRQNIFVEKSWAFGEKKICLIREKLCHIEVQC